MSSRKEKGNVPAPVPALNLNLRFFAWPGLALLLAVGPLLRGLFFEPDLLPAQILMAAVFLLVAWQEVLERRPLLGRHPLDWAALALVAAYGLSYFVAVDRRAAYGEILKYATYFMAYYAASRLVAAAGGAKQAGAGGARAGGAGRAAAMLARIVVASATVVAALGVLASAGVVDFPGAYSGGHILSTLQYHNALGGFMVVANLLALALLSGGGRTIGQAAGGAALYFCIAALLGTLSRGAWLAGLAGLGLLLATLPPAQRWRALYAQGVVLVLAGVAMRAVLPGVGKPGYHGVGVLAAGLILAVILVPAYDRAARWLDTRPLRPQTRRLAPWLGAAYIVVVAAFYFAYTATALPTPASQILPETVVYRAAAIDAGQASVVMRKDSMGDALRIWRDHPVLGAGGGGWNALYHRYQRSLYWTTEVHSGPLQVAVETGVPGAAAFLAAWWLFVRGAWRLWRRGLAAAGPGAVPGQPGFPGLAAALPAGLGVAGLALGLHSVGDFDLSLPALAVILWTLFGTVAGLEVAGVQGQVAGTAGRTVSRTTGHPASAADGERPGGWWRWLPATGRAPRASLAVVAVAAALALALPSAGLYRAGRLGAEGARLMSEGKLEEAAENLSAAAALDPRRASFRLDLGQILSVVGVVEGRPDLLQRGEEEVRAALGLQPRDIPVAMRAVEVFTLQGKPDLAAEQAERLVGLLPMATFPYERLAMAYVAAAQAQLRYGERDRAEAYIDKAAGVPARVEGLRTGRGGLRGSARPQVTSPIRLAAAQALYLRGDEAKAVEALQPLVRDGQVGEVAALWLAARRARGGEDVARAAADLPADLRPALDDLVGLPRPADIR